MKAMGVIFSNIYDSSLGELTNHRTVASLPFGGRYRQIDFILSSMSNSGIYNIGIITKYNYRSLMDHLASGRYQYLDRSKVSGEELGRLYRQVFSADWYLASSNAVTEKGELFNVDGNSNRVAAITFGPKNVLLIVGCNKIVPDLAAAQARVKTIAAPANTIRLNCKTPCAVTGQCADCHSPARVCCTTTIHQFQRVKGRIKVLLVGEPLGF